MVVDARGREPSPRRILWLLVPLVVSVAAASWLAFAGWSIHRSERRSTERIIALEHYRSEVLRLDEVLTMSANMAAATGEDRWIERYEASVEPLEAAIAGVRALVPLIGRTFDEITGSANDQLVEMEARALRLAQRGRTEEALALLVSPRYEAQKRQYLVGIARLDEDVAKRRAGEAAGRRRTAIAATTVSAAAVIASIVVWMVVVVDRLRSLRRAHDRSLIAEREAATTLATTLGATGDAIAITGIDGRLLQANEEYGDLAESLSRSKDDSPSTILDDSVVNAEELRESSAALDANAGQEHRALAWMRDGRVFERTTATNEGPMGESLGRVWRFRDVSDQFRLQGLTDNLMTAVSHAVKTPLATVAGAAATLHERRASLTEDQQRELLQSLSRNASKLRGLLEDMFDLDRLLRGARTPALAEVDIAELVSDLVADPDQRGWQGLQVDVESVGVTLDRAQIERTLDVLITNAYRHTPDGTRVWIKGEAYRSGVLVTVSDSGPGIPDSMKRMIFEPFTHAGSESGHDPGLGVGLALAAEFVAVHGGRTWVEDRPGGGASFKVYLPRRSPAASS